MKRICRGLQWMVLSWMVAAGNFSMAQPAAGPAAKIVSVRVERTDLVVQVEASTTLTRVTLESATRVNRSAWEPRAVQHLADRDGLVALLEFKVPISSKMEILRVRGDTASALPLSFYEGTNKFTSTENSAGGPTRAGPGGDFAEAAPADQAREVVESDIWKIDGDTLYFYNSYRGLQVMDISKPDAPVLRSTYELAAGGEQMYLAAPGKVVLLARDNCNWNGSKALLIDTTGAKARLVAELPVPGYTVESRMVGTALYVVSQSYHEIVIPLAGGGFSQNWEAGSSVNSFDLRDFEKPVAKSSEWVPGYNNVIMATDRFLFVAKQEYSAATSRSYSTLNIFDISAPDGTFAKLSAFSAAGTIRDKFKMNVDGDVLALVVQQNGLAGQPTVVQTVSLADPRAPRELGFLKIVENEQLHATRFAGKLLYAVTFFRIDPLWIIDLADPAAPRKVGELEIPGWSTYIHPLPGQLLTIGLDTTNGWRTSVQLFDVRDPAKPALLSKILLGDNYSHSEANWDEKAFAVLARQNLVLVPFQGNVSNSWMQGVQIIDLEPARLVQRGIIKHDFTPRRSTFHRDRILSISGRELLSVDAMDRDNPKIVHAEELSWPAEKVHLAGQYLLEIEKYGGSNPAIRVVAAAQPGELLSTTALSNIPFLGSEVRGDKLYTLQGRGRQVTWPTVWTPTNQPIATNPAVLVASVFDLSQLPQVKLLGQTRKESLDDTYYYYYGNYAGLWVKENVLVWATEAQNWWRGWWGPYDVASAAPEGRAADFAAPWIWWGGGQGHFVAVDISTPTPVIASETRIRGTNNWWSFSESFTTNGLVYTSHLASEFDPSFDPPPTTYLSWDGTKYVTITNDPPPGRWVQRHYLDVIDYADPAEPLVRKPVNIPGSLQGIDRRGELLYTRAFQYQGAESREILSASAYNGIEARLAASMALPQSWSPLLADGPHIYLIAPPDTNHAQARLQVWTLPDSGQFTLLKSVDLRAAPYQMEKFGNLLALSQYSSIDLFDAGNPAQLRMIGGGQSSACWGSMLDGGDGDTTRGLWLPMGAFGVTKIPLGWTTTSERAIQPTVNAAGAEVRTKVTVQVFPGSGTSGYAIEEKLPGGFGATEINLGGAFDSASGKISWGPFNDAAPRVATYQLAFPAAFIGVTNLNGSVIVDGTVVPTRGANLLSVPPPESKALRKIVIADSIRVEIQITPVTGMTNYVLEETLPLGFKAIDINQNGVDANIDEQRTRLRWTFADNQPRTVAYTVVPAVGFWGRAAVYGSLIYGNRYVTVQGDVEFQISPPKQND